MRDLLKDPSLAKKQVKTVMIPTTCGTGSEATCNAIVAIPEEESKKGIVNDSMIPDYVLLDSQMIRKLPKAIVAATWRRRRWLMRWSVIPPKRLLHFPIRMRQLLRN